MLYKALYRKYRPKNFNEVAGQKTIVQILKNSIINDKVSHAYLFYGPRGTGKTSIAKIFAKTINCDNSIDGIACNKCSKCLENNNNDVVDIIEIDAASNNGVDEIRELKSKVNLVPSSMKYKVYIIDEVHMLSIGAFNALLKTLEEPPHHVIFILATTELNKVPSTIVSRCQVMEFRKIPQNDMFDSIKNVVLNENIKINDEAIVEIIRYSDGGMRDALSLLDKLSLYSNDEITEEEVRNLCGNATRVDVKNILSYIIDKKPDLLVDKIDELYAKGVDLINVANDLLLLLKDEFLSNNESYICFITLEMVDIIEKMKHSFSPRIVFEAYLIKNIIQSKGENISREIFSDEKCNNTSGLKKATKSELLEESLESSCEKNTLNNDILNNENISREIFLDQKKSENKTNEEKIIENSKKDLNVDYAKNKIESDAFKNVRVNNAFVDADKTILNNIQNSWNDLSKYTFDSDYGAIACSLMDSKPVLASSKYIVIMFKYDSLVDKSNNNFYEIQKFIAKLTGVVYKIVCVTKDEWDKKKQEYIIKKRNKENYFYIDDDYDINKGSSVDKKNNEEVNDDLTSITTDLFGKENIIIN